jgi:hypothetical protein
MSDKKPMEDLLYYPSSVHCVCAYCGGSAHYSGRPDDINKATKEFYEIHERCFMPIKDKTTKGVRVDNERH